MKRETMLLKIAPILRCISLQDTNAWYRNRLNFSTRYYGNYLVAVKDEIEIHFEEWPDQMSFVPTSCYLYDNNINDLYARFTSLDAVFPKGILKTNMWGKKEFQVMDNNNNILKFSGL